MRSPPERRDNVFAFAIIRHGSRDPKGLRSRLLLGRSSGVTLGLRPSPGCGPSLLRLLGFLCEGCARPLCPGHRISSTLSKLFRSRGCLGASVGGTLLRRVHVRLQPLCSLLEVRLRRIHAFVHRLRPFVRSRSGSVRSVPGGTLAVHAAEDLDLRCHREVSLHLGALESLDVGVSFVIAVVAIASAFVAAGIVGKGRIVDPSTRPTDAPRRPEVRRGEGLGDLRGRGITEGRLLRCLGAERPDPLHDAVLRRSRQT
mmetsp:Transcript_32271/g.102634  ORF Transcript_32271/g.102634 Transcript_32271/m.102634 type:complete len:257 (-) Transcript_32271:2369-3139(-)